MLVITSYCSKVLKNLKFSTIDVGAFLVVLLLKKTLSIYPIFDENGLMVTSYNQDCTVVRLVRLRYLRKCKSLYRETCNERLNMSDVSHSFVPLSSSLSVSIPATLFPFSICNTLHFSSLIKTRLYLGSTFVGTQTKLQRHGEWKHFQQQAIIICIKHD